MANHTFYLEIAKEAGMASDENDNPSEAYLKISFDSSVESLSEEQVVNLASMNSMIEKEYLRSITREEYASHMEAD